MPEQKRNEININQEQPLQNHGGSGNLVVNNPTLILGLGGTGATFARAIKKKMQGCDNSQMFRVLVIDTDVEERKDLDRDEFFNISMLQVVAALQKPELQSNKYLLQQIGVMQGDTLNTSLRDELLTILKHGTFQGAAHVRPLGYTAGGASCTKIYRQVQSLIDYLTGLKPAFNQAGNENYQLTVFIAASLYGGTGSSTFLRLLTMICNMQNNVNISLINFLPTFVDTYEKRDWYLKRSYANAYAAARELDYVHQNVANRVAGFQLGDMGSPLRNDLTTIKYAFLVDHYNMQGNAIELNQAIDAAAVHVAAMIGTPIGAEFGGRERDSQYLSRLKRDEETGEDCVYSSFGAIALTIPIKELEQYILVKGKETCCSIILEDSSESNKVRERVDNFLMSLNSGRSALDTRAFYEDIVSDLHQKKNQFLKIQPSPLKKPEKEFLGEVAQRTRQGTAEQLLERIKDELANACTDLLSALKKDAFLEGNHPAGLTATRSILTVFAEKFRERRISQEAEVVVLLKELNKSERDRADRSKALNDFFGKEQKRKRYVDISFSILEKQLKKEIAELVIGNLSKLCEDLDNHINTINESIRRTEDCKKQAAAEADQILNEISDEEILLSSAEVNLFVRDDFREFFDKHLEELKSRLYDMIPADLQNFCLTFYDPENQRQAMDCIHQTYDPYISQLNILTYLCNGIKPGWPRQALLNRRLERTFQICSAMWGIQYGYDQHLDRMTVCGVPCDDDSIPQDFKDFVEKAIGTFNDISYVKTKVKTKLYVVTRVHGATLNYLSCWPGMKRHYVEWLTSKTLSHPLHIISPDVIKECERSLKKLCAGHFDSKTVEDEFFSSPFLANEENDESPVGSDPISNKSETASINTAPAATHEITSGQNDSLNKNGNDDGTNGNSGINVNSPAVVSREDENNSGRENSGLNNDENEEMV